MSGPRVLVAPDKFKGSLPGAAVAAHLAAGLRRGAPGVAVDEMPVADGGEGTLAAALAAGFGEVSLVATGPLGEPRPTRYAVRGSTAVVEMAAVSGLEMLTPDDRTARHATSRGVGEVIRHAVDRGARTVVLGIGGSASTDGGAGMLAALGVRLRGSHGPLPDGGDALRSLAAVDVGGLDPRLAGVGVVLASDVDNPLLGPSGAAAVYGPQKGADARAVADLEDGLRRWVDALARAGVRDADLLAGAPGAGAAGGVGFAALAVLGARRRPGVDVVLELVGFDERVRGADLVVTGEGSLDAQSLHGKAPIGVAAAAGRQGVPVVLVCGRNRLAPAETRAAGIDAVHALTELEPDVRRCIDEAGPLLERLGERIAAERLAGAPAAGGPGGAARTRGRFDLVVRARRVLGPDGFGAHAVGVRDGVVAAVVPLGQVLDGDAVVELADHEVLLPGLVDTHVHVDEPGRTDWEGFASATRAAAAGGVTTLVDMPLNSVPPTTDVAALEVKRAAARGACSVDVAFWGGAVPGNGPHLRPLHDAGVLGFKCFTVDPGVPEFGHLDPAGLEAAMRRLATFDGLLLVHAEDPDVLGRAPAARGPRYADFLASRPPEAETTAIGRVVDAARRTGARVHLVHLSSASALPVIAAARADGVRLTVETCPHYLALSAERVPDGATTFKCCPPIRDAANRDALWDALLDGTIDAVVSDHSPSPPELKRLDTGDFGAAWGGISSLQLGLPVVWTHARRRGVPLERVVPWMSSGPARLAGLRRKGGIAVGLDADLVVLDPDAALTVDPSRLLHRHPVTPYAGHALTGVVRRTLLRGRDATDPGRGTLLARGDA